MEVVCNICSKAFNFRGGGVHFNRNKNHYCSKECNIKANTKHGLASKIDGKQSKIYRVWCSAKKRAKKKGVVFSLNIEDMPVIPEICPVLGIKIKENNASSPLDSSPSLDRINPKQGYVKGNVRIICNRANRIKSDATLKELKLILRDAQRIHGKH